ncbi:hypothetical protein ASNO1_73890 [Corallococcus caeni]|uniref:Uncharacterized protein n=1 Tax=Corallococcus caeni TaxID=3082388 RepID=A0ABQ6R487_9BACT|nr:hypothetical protein ASNO1_73890 [Corallococcus sp. NO1]
MGELIRTRIQLRIGQMRPLEHRGQCLGRIAHLRLEERVHARFRERRPRGVPLHQDFVPFSRGQQRQSSNGLIRLRDGFLQEHAQVLGHAGGGGGGEEVGGVFEVALEACVRLQHLERQVELGGEGVELHRLQLHALDGGGAAEGGLVGEHHLEEGGAPRDALGLQLLHETLDGKLLVLLGAEHRLAHLAQERAEGVAARHARAKHLGVDEEADEAFHLSARAARHGRADGDVLLAAVAGHQQLPARQQRHVEGGTFLLRQGLECVRQLSGQQHVMPSPPAVANGGTREVGGQLQRGGHPGELLLPVVELLLQPRAPQPLALPDAEVRVLHAQGRQGHGLASREGAVEQRHLAHQQRHGPAVGDDVVHHHDEQVLSRR